MMIFTVTGCFRERGSNQNNIRHFNRLDYLFNFHTKAIFNVSYNFRCFIVVPQNTGFCIINETLFVTPATDLSKRKPFMSKPETSSPSVASTSIDDNTKKSLATSFSQKSGMNLQFSADCLEQANWDFDKAAVLFGEAKAGGKIPPEAYVM